MTVFLSAITLTLFGILAGIAVANWQKGGLGNYWHAFGWGIASYIVFGFGAAFTYYYAIIKPAKSVTLISDAPRPADEHRPEVALAAVNRAFVAIESAHLTVFQIGKKTEALVTFINSGRVPALNVRVYGHIQLRDKPLENHMPGAKDIGEEPSQDIMPANGGTVLMPISSGSELTPRLMEMIDKNTHRIYVWGVVTYEDAFGPHWTKFCMIQYQKTTKLEMCTNNNESGSGETSSATPVARAWITVQSAGFITFKVGEPVRVRAVFVNSGDTPAYDLVTGGRVEIRNSDSPVPSPMPVEQIKFNDGVGILGAKGNTYHLSGAVDVPLRQETLGLINQGRMRVYIWGMVKYEDVSRTPRWLKFCLVNSVGTEDFAPCPNNNEGN